MGNMMLSGTGHEGKKEDLQAVAPRTETFTDGNEDTPSTVHARTPIDSSSRPFPARHETLESNNHLKSATGKGHAPPSIGVSIKVLEEDNRPALDSYVVTASAFRVSEASHHTHAPQHQKKNIDEEIYISGSASATRMSAYPSNRIYPAQPKQDREIQCSSHKHVVSAGRDHDGDVIMSSGEPTTCNEVKERKIEQYVGGTGLKKDENVTEQGEAEFSAFPIELPPGTLYQPMNAPSYPFHGATSSLNPKTEPTQVTTVRAERAQANETHPAESHVPPQPQAPEPPKLDATPQEMMELEKLNNLYADADEEIETPKELNVTLHPHQKRAVCWMVKREKRDESCTTRYDRECRGGILADDQGLGKTITTIALMCANPPKNNSKWNCLIVCPTSLVNQWAKELHDRIHPEYRKSIHVYHGTNKVTTVSELATFDVVITTYGTLRREYPKIICRLPEPIVRSKGLLFRHKFSRIVCDEAHAMRNLRTDTWKAVYEITSSCRWALTGTPVQNSITELWALLRFCRHNIASDMKDWNRRWKKRLEHNNPRIREKYFKQLRAIVSVVMLRRSKNDKINGKPIVELPKRTSGIVDKNFEFEEETSTYLKVLEESVVVFDKVLRTGTLREQMSCILVKLLRLRQAAFHPYLIEHCYYLRKFKKMKQSGADAEISKEVENYAELMEETKKKPVSIGEMLNEFDDSDDEDFPDSDDDDFIDDRSIDEIQDEVELVEEEKGEVDEVVDDVEERRRKRRRRIVDDCDDDDQQGLPGNTVENHQKVINQGRPNGPAILTVPLNDTSSPMAMKQELTGVMDRPLENSVSVKNEKRTVLRSQLAEGDSTIKVSSRMDGWSSVANISTRNSSAQVSDAPGIALAENALVTVSSTNVVDGSVPDSSGPSPMYMANDDASNTATDPTSGKKEEASIDQPVIRTENTIAQATKIRVKNDNATLPLDKAAGKVEEMDLSAVVTQPIAIDAEPSITSAAHSIVRGEHIQVPVAPNAVKSEPRTVVMGSGINDTNVSMPESVVKNEDIGDGQPVPVNGAHKENKTGESSARGKKRKREHLTKKELGKKMLKAVMKPSTKINALLEKLKQSREHDPSRKSLIFSQWTSCLDIVKHHVEHHGFKCARLHGGMSLKQRAKEIEKFDTPEYSLFLISLKAGGEGLNLTMASQVFLMDAWWNPAVEEQAIDRVHRIGQKHDVNVYRFRITNSMEDKVYQVSDAKRQIIAGAVGELGAQSYKRGKLTFQDLIMLFRGAAEDLIQHGSDDSRAQAAALSILNR